MAGLWTTVSLVVFSLLTFTSPDSLSLYWSPVTQPSSSSKLVTVPSKIVTLGGGGNYTIKDIKKNSSI